MCAGCCALEFAPVCVSLDRKFNIGSMHPHECLHMHSLRMVHASAHSRTKSDADSQEHPVAMARQSWSLPSVNCRTA